MSMIPGGVLQYGPLHRKRCKTSQESNTGRIRLTRGKFDATYRCIDIHLVNKSGDCFILEYDQMVGFAALSPYLE